MNLVYEEKEFLDKEGLKVLCQEVSAKIEESAFSGNYEDLNNKPTIQKMTVDEETETLIIK